MTREERILREYIRGREGDTGIYRGMARLYDVIYSRDADYDSPEKEIRSRVEEGSRVLVVGCGTGLLIERLEPDYEVTGVDVSGDMLEVASERVSSDLMEQDVRKLSLDQDFDAGVAFGQPLNHLDTREELLQALENICESLSTGGIFMADSFTEEAGEMESLQKRSYEFGDVKVEVQEKFSDFDPDENSWKTEFTYRLIDRENSRSRRVTDSHRLIGFSHQELREKLEKAGFIDVETQRFYGSDSFFMVAASKA